MVRDDGRAAKTGLISNQGGGNARARRAGLVSWCLYDWANSAFSTIVSTFVFPVYFTQRVARDPIQGATQWSYAVAAAALVVALGAPALGAVADNLGRRKPWLFAFTLLTLVFTTALWWVEPSPQFALPALALYAAAATSFGFAMIFYDAMLRSDATQRCYAASPHRIISGASPAGAGHWVMPVASSVSWRRCLVC